MRFKNLLLLLCFWSAASWAEDSRIPIGVVSVLTGESAPTGLDVKDAIEFADKKFGHNRYRLVVEDDRCLGKEGVSTATKLVSIDGVRGAVGFTCSSSFLPAVGIYERAKVPAIVGCASSPKISRSGTYVFRTALEDGALGRLLGRYTGDRHKKIAVLSEETDYAQDLLEVFTREAESKGSEVLNENFLPSTPDFRSTLLRLKQKNPEALFINSEAERTFAVILTQLDQLGWKPALYGAYWPGSTELLSIARASLEGVVYADTPSLDEMLTEEGRDLFKEYQAAGGKIRSVEAMWASSVEAFRALDAALQSGKDVREFLHSNMFHGIFGDYTFDERGEMSGVLPVLKVIKNGQPSPLKYEKH